MLLSQAKFVTKIKQHKISHLISFMIKFSLIMYMICCVIIKVATMEFHMDFYIHGYNVCSYTKKNWTAVFEELCS